MSGKHVAVNPATLGHDHKPVQHRDSLEPWCNSCALTADGRAPRLSFAGGPSSRVDPRGIR